MKTTELYVEKHLDSQKTAADFSGIVLLLSETCDALPVRISLWKGELKKYEFHMITSEWTDGVREMRAEILNTDHKTAERIFRMIVRGAVPPSTLCEVLSDLLS